MDEITDEQYSMCLRQLAILAGLVIEMPLDGFISRINTCEAVAPLINPILYMQGADKMQAVKDLAVALKPFKKVAMKVKGVC